MNKKIIALTLAAGFLAVPLSAKVSFTLDIEALTKADGTTPLANDGLLVLVVDAGGDGFSMPLAGSFEGGNDKVVATWDLSEAQREISEGQTAFNFVTPGGVNYDSAWEGDDLALFWYPGLGEGQTPAADSVFGFFADSFGLTSGAEWKMPGDGTLNHSLTLFTAAADTWVKFGGDVPNAIGRAAYAVNDATFPGATAPSDLSLSHVGAAIRVDWTGGSAQGGGFIVQRRNSGSGVWESIGIVDNGTNTFTDTTVKPGAQYDYQLVAINGFQSAMSSPEFIEALRARFTALSTRAVMKTGLFAPIMGVAMDGTEDIKVIINAVGPSMGGNLPKAADTYVTVKQGATTVFENDDWESNANYTAEEITAAIATVGGRQLQPGNKDASAILTLGKITGGYTMPVRDPTGAESICSLQMYDVSFRENPELDGRISALSTRAYVGTGDEVAIGSFAIGGAVPMKVIIRAKGPAVRDRRDDDALTSDNVLNDPQLALRRNGVDLFTNDNWEDRVGDSVTMEEILAAETGSGLAPFADGSEDALILATLEPGLYSAIVSGVSSQTGIMVLEIYEVRD